MMHPGSLAALVLAQAVAASPSPGGPAASFAPAIVATPASAPAPAPGDAVITNSGSTNTAGYAIVVRRDGKAAVSDAGGTRQASIGRAQTAWLFAKLDEDAPLDALPTAHCMRSASFGTVTRIAYRGATTGDLGCGAAPQVAELRRTVATIVGQLGIATRHFRMLRPLVGH